jgi:hypothetical protein
MRSILRQALVFVATLSLGGVAIAQAEQDAFAEEGMDKQQQTQKQNMQKQKSQNQKLSYKQQTQYLQNWADAEEPSATDQYSSNGLQLVYGALDGITKQLKQQPVGGGPTDKMTKQERQKMQQERQQVQQALKQIQSQHQQLKQIAGEIEGDQNLMQRPQKFQQGAMSVVSILDTLQKAKFSEFSDQVKEVRQSAEKIEVTKPLAAQRDNVRNFFVGTSDVLNQMAIEIEKQQSAVGGGPTEDSQQKQMKQNKQNKQDKQDKQKQKNKQNQQEY